MEDGTGPNHLATDERCPPATAHCLSLLGAFGASTLVNDGGERVRKISFAGETVWIDDIYEREPGRTLCHVQAGDRRIVTFSADGSEFYYYHSDHLGSSSLMTDQDGSLVRQQYGYRAFGSERFALSFSPSFTSRFTGQQFDTETGLYYYQSRFYDPELGRFIQPDTIVPDPGSSQSLNRYSYVLNNPLKYIDPTGHAQQTTSFFGGSGTLGFGSGRDWLGAGWGTSGLLGAGFGRDWLGLGWQAGGFGAMAGSSMGDPYALWDAVADSPSRLSGYDKLSFLDKWNYQKARAFEDTLKSAASVSLMALSSGASIIRSAAAARVGVTFPVTRMEPILAKSAPETLALVPKGTKSLGRWGEARLAQVLGEAGVKPAKPFSTSLGSRYIDRLVDGIAHESKAGLNVRLNSTIERQILKDAELIQAGRIQGAHWHFFQGAQSDVLKSLTKHGIKYTVY